MATANTQLITDAALHDDASACFLDDLAAVKRFALAGKATFTIANTHSNRRFTFKVARPRRAPESRRYVYARGSWGFFRLGSLKIGETVEWTALGRGDGIEAVAFAWLVGRFNARDGRGLPPFVKVWHAGQCGRCGIELTSEFRFIHYGPVCCGHLGIDPVEEIGQLPVNQAAEAIRAAVASGNLTLVRKLAKRCAEPVVKRYAADHLAA